jgi:uncharacterized protein
MTEFETIMFIVFIFSIVQSVFGVGILVFGTPTCLLLGYPFEVTISYLLPASIGISCMQNFHGRDDIKLRKEFFILTIPFIIIGLTLVLIKWFYLDMKIMVGVMLILTGGIRLLPKFQNTMEYFIKKHMKLYLIGMGFIHGLSNMGGGLLTILSSTLFKDKKEIRANIATGYLIFATTQITVLAVLKPSIFHLNIIVFPFLSLFTYIFLGNILFLKSKEKIYQKLITVFILAYGVVLLLPT